MKSTIFPTLTETIELQKELIKRFGGEKGVRDMGLLESALSRPKSGYYESLSLQAAALMQSLALNHSFIDGNKRVAFALTAIFLRMNGYKLIVSPKEGEHFLIHEIIINKVSLETIAKWLEDHMKKV